MIEINDPTDVRVQEFLTLRNKNTGDSILCDSEKVVSKLFETNLKVKKVFVTNEYYHTNKELLENRVDPHSLFVSTKKIIEQVIGYKLHHGIMAKAERPRDINLNKLDQQIIVLNGVTSPENIGAIVRSAAAFGINSIITDSKSASPYLRRAIRVSMGNVFYTKHFKSLNLYDDLKQLENLGYTILGTANEEDSISLAEFNFPKKCALIIGSEGWGMDATIRNTCSQTIKIPIKEEVAHLNAAMAASIFFYHLKQ